MNPIADIPDNFWPAFTATCQRLKCNPIDLAAPLFNESGLRANAHNPTGNASGIFQAMPATLRGLGFQGGWQKFVTLNATAQLQWLEKYYKPYTGRLVNATAVYMATFCPAFLSHADNPTWRICSRDGTANDSPLGEHLSKLWYAQNRGLDVNNDGCITVDDLAKAIERACKGPRWGAVKTKLVPVSAASSLPQT